MDSNTGSGNRNQFEYLIRLNNENGKLTLLDGIFS